MDICHRDSFTVGSISNISQGKLPIGIFVSQFTIREFTLLKFVSNNLFQEIYSTYIRLWMTLQEFTCRNLFLRDYLCRVGPNPENGTNNKVINIRWVDILCITSLVSADEHFSNPFLSFDWSDWHIGTWDFLLWRKQENL